MKNTTFGNGWMHRQLVATLRWMDVRLLYAFTAIFIIPVCLLLNTNHSRTTAYRFFRFRLRYGKLRAAWATYVNHCLFAQVVVDRFAMFAGQCFKVSVEGYELFQRLAEQPQAFMQLSSHIGCYEVAGYSLKAKTKRFNALVFGGEKATVMEGRKLQLERNNIRMIPVMPDMSHLFLINEALAQNEIVSMPADRIVGSSKTVNAMFFGDEASFPVGPFAVATMRSLDVISVNVMKTKTKGYTVYLASLDYDKNASRREQIRQLAQSYANELQRIVERYPTQWYNFHDFWTKTQTEL